MVMAKVSLRRDNMESRSIAARVKRQNRRKTRDRWGRKKIRFRGVGGGGHTEPLVNFSKNRKIRFVTP